MKRALNLMSERARKREQMRTCVRLWSRLLVVVLVGLTLCGIVEWRACRLEQSRYAAVDAEYEPIRQLKIENGRLQKQIDLLRKAERIPLELASHRPLLGLIGLAAQAVTQQEGMVYLQQIEIERAPFEIQPTRQKKLGFALEGVSVDSSAVTRLADSLREAGPFASVELTTNKSSLVGKQEQQVFFIQCTN